MLTTKEIRDKAERSYKDFLLSVLQRKVFFPFHIKGNKGNANLPLQELYPALKHLIDHSKEKMGYGFTLTYKEVNTRHSGVMTMPDAIFFENPKDFLQFIEKESDFLVFRKALEVTKRHVPVLLVWIEENVLKFQKNAPIWEDILKIVLYFHQNHLPNCYWRQLPVSVDLAEMEAHQILIGELLEVILPFSAINHEEKQFEPRFGLRYDEPMLHIRFLDKNQTLPFGKNIIFPLSQITDLEDITFEKIFFITDKSVFLAFPNLGKSIAIFWEHNNDILAKATIFSAKQCYCCNDISPKAFQQLSEMREFLPSLLPFLIDKMTFDAFAKHHQTQKMANHSNFLLHLTPDEQVFYQFLLNLEEKNTLLQRYVSHSFLEKQVVLL